MSLTDSQPGPHFFSMPLSGYRGKIPFVLTDLISRLEELNADQQEGIFRLSGRKSDVEKISALMDRGRIRDWSQYPDFDANTVACALKKYLQSLSGTDPLIGRDISDEISSAIQLLSDDQSVCAELKRLLVGTPASRRGSLTLVMKYLKKVADNSSVNNMTPYNLSVCLTLVIFPQTDTIASGNSMKAFELFLTNFDDIFEAEWCDARYFLTDSDIDKISAPAADVDEALCEQQRREQRRGSSIPYDRAELLSALFVRRPARPAPEHC